MLVCVCFFNKMGEIWGETERTQGLELHFFLVAITSAGGHGAVIPGSCLPRPPRIYYFLHLPPSSSALRRVFSAWVTCLPLQDDRLSQHDTFSFSNNELLEIPSISFSSLCSRCPLSLLVLQVLLPLPLPAHPSPLCSQVPTSLKPSQPSPPWSAHAAPLVMFDHLSVCLWGALYLIYFCSTQHSTWLIVGAQ